MNCRRVQNKLSEYIDGELSVAEAGRVAAHLAVCGECRAEETALRRTIGLTQAWGVHQPGPELEWRLDPAVLAQRAREETRVPWVRRLEFVFAPAVTAAAGALLVAALWPRTQPGPLQPPRAAIQPPPAAVARSAEPPQAQVERLSTPPAAVAAERSSRRVASNPAPRIRERVRVALHRHAESRPALRHVHQRTLPRTVAAVVRVPVVERRADAPARPAPVASAGSDPMPTPEPISLSQTMYASGRYAEAIGVLNAVFERTASRFTDQERALLAERNALADSTIVECSAALRADPGNANARKFLDEAYEAKVALVRSLAS